MFDPEGFITVAEDNGHSICSEAQQRTAMSRLYYAAFLTSREFLAQKTNRGFGSGSDVHKTVIRALKDWNPGIGRDLEQLRTARNEADYDLVLSIDSIMSDYQSHLDAARHIIKMINREKRTLGL